MGGRVVGGQGGVGGAAIGAHVCLCPVDGEIDGALLPACAAPASQHAD